MPALSLTVPHRLPPDEALARVRRCFDDGLREHRDAVRDVDVQWGGSGARFALRARGMAVSGTLTVRTRAVRVAVKLPLAALPLRSRIEQVVTRALRDELSARGDG